MALLASHHSLICFHSKQPHCLLGMMAGAAESLTGKSAWRGPSDVTVSYLRFLAENGYGLSPVEQVMVGDKSVEDCLAELSE